MEEYYLMFSELVFLFTVSSRLPVLIVPIFPSLYVNDIFLHLYENGTTVINTPISPA